MICSFFNFSPTTFCHTGSKGFLFSTAVIVTRPECGYDQSHLIIQGTGCIFLHTGSSWCGQLFPLNKLNIILSLTLLIFFNQSTIILELIYYGNIQDFFYIGHMGCCIWWHKKGRCDYVYIEQGPFCVWENDSKCSWKQACLACIDKIMLTPTCMFTLFWIITSRIWSMLGDKYNTHR